MADLFLGQVHGDAGYERSVVVKTLRGDLADDEELARQIVEEARIASSLEHENIVRTLEVGEEGETRFLAMEFVFGRTLRQVIDRCAETGTTMPFPHIVTLILDALSALEYAHEHATRDGIKLNLIHRDVSPSNLMVGFDGVTRLLDFGLAKGTLQLHRTRAGVVKGNYGYMSPEQVQREDLDGRSDLFSLGIVLWELLCGRRLFEGTHELEVIRAVVKQSIPFAKRVNPEVPFSLAWSSARALRRRRGLRYPSARAMRQALLKYDDRDRDDARDQLSDWLRSLFHFELATRDAALQRARPEPIYFRMLRDSGFELLPEVTDPAIPRVPSFAPNDSKPLPRGWLSALSSSRWFGVVLVAVVFFSIGLGVLIGRTHGPAENAGYLYVIADRPAMVSVGGRGVGRTPVQRVPVLPGRHRVVLRSDGALVVRVVDVRAGQNRLVKGEFGPGD